MQKPDLVGAHEIEERHGIARYRIFRFIRRDLWPAPVVRLKCGDVFDGSEVAAAVERLRAGGQL